MPICDHHGRIGLAGLDFLAVELFMRSGCEKKIKFGLYCRDHHGMSLLLVS